MPEPERDFTPLQTRLFPKHQGSDAYQLTGLAAKAGWVLLSDHTPPQALLRDNRAAGGDPRVIFLSMRNGFAALRHFAQKVLPDLTRPFVLVSGSEDMTLPRQIDQRWRSFDGYEQDLIAQIAGHALLRRWFVENLDSTQYPVMTPLPLGLVFPESPEKPALTWPKTPKMADRALRVLVAHRRREGPQWQPRHDSLALAKGPWASFCTVIEQEISEAEYHAQIAQHAFVLCVEGGGLDPSPKAWDSLIHGAIPIIRQSPTASAYHRLPVALVPDWQDTALSQAKLAFWHEQLQGRFDHPSARETVKRQLGLEHWWAEILAAL